MSPLVPLALAAALLAAPALPPAGDAPPRRVLTLEEAVRTALAHQPQLREARANTGAALARADQSRSPLLPQVAGQAGYERTGAERASASTSAALAGASGATSGGSSERWSANAQASQALFDAAALARWRAARASASATRAAQDTAVEGVVATVRAAWFLARADRDLVAVARDALENQEAHLRQVQAFVEVGTRPAIDLAQARADRANARLALIRAENGAGVARLQLQQAMGLGGPPDFEVGDDVPGAVEGEDGPPEALFAEAVANRPELRVLAEQARAQRLAGDAARAGWIPTLGAQAGAGEAGRGLDQLRWSWNAGVTLSWPLFQGGLREAQAREAEAGLAGLDAQAEALRQQVALEVEQARLGVRAARAALEASGEARVAARERLRLAEGRYEAGAGSIIELGDAQLAATNAAAQEVVAAQDLARSRSELSRALGRGP